MISNAIGIAAGFALGVLLAGNRPRPVNELIATGWDVYDAKILTIVGITIGLFQWLALRQQVKTVGWLSISGAFGGFLAGAFEGSFKDTYILALGMTSNSLGERLCGASLVATPTAHMILGLVTGTALALALAQYSWQVRKLSTAGQELPAG